MSELAKIKQKFAKELLRHFELEEESLAAVKPEETPLVCIQSLMAGKCYHDAVKLLAHGMPKREAVWWACLAVRHSLATMGTKADAIGIAAVDAAEVWAREPSEENRRRARLSGEKAGYKSAAGWAATAAYWSTGSLTPEGEPVVPPPPYLYAHAVAGSVSLAAVLPDPNQAEEKYLRYLKQGLDLANGGRGEFEKEQIT